MRRTGLRRRILGLCAGLAAGAILAVGAALWIGAQSGPGGWATAFVIAAFAQLGLVTLVWYVLDQSVARPVDRIAAELRVRAHAGHSGALDLADAQHLGDLAPAADAVTRALGAATLETAQAVAAETAHLEAERARLTALLTEIPVACLMVNAANRIVLYDGQAAEILAQSHTPRLLADPGDYFDPDTLSAARAKMQRSGLEVDFHLRAADGALRYSAKMKPMEDGGYLLVIDDAETRLPPEAARPIVYDFALLDAAPQAALEATALSRLCFCVFDTETTGLLPHRDEVVQIGAVRVLNGRLVPGERLETLVDPGRPIPEAATRVHGIGDHAVAGAPDIAMAGRRLHAFAREAVIVAHNAPFDMAFLRRHADRMGVEWSHPVIDTVLVSAVLFGITETHTLDALCRRLGIALPAERRHTAMGDAEATAQALLRMIPMLEGRGITTLGALLAETKRYGRLLEDLN
ncbi:3'-5' exonuclease [Roseivivax sp. CAU 1761]